MALLTTLSPRTLKQAEAMAKAYRKRWKIENYLQFIKGRFRLEDVMIKLPKRVDGLLALVLIASAFVMKGLPLSLFPITAHRSDMLPILKEGALSLLHGDNPYQYYLLDNGARTQNVRLPGLMMAYLPAAVAGVDLRWVTLAFELAIVLMVLFHFRGAFKQGEVPWEILWAMTGFLLLPYWHYRHELYETPFWSLLLVTLFALARGRGWGFTLGVGAMVGTHQWGWLFAPFLLLSWCRMKGWKAMGWSGLGALVVGGLILAVGIRSHVREFYEHVFGFYIKRFKINELYPMSLYFAPWFIKWNLTRWLFPIQCLLQVPLLALAYRYGRRMSALAGILALS
ncbi:MAG: transposase [Elusimicrobia bacterium]|nr:transposase [Elusimicrobiota bacterium]